MKTFVVVAQFPDVLVKYHTQQTTVKAGRLSLAILRGLDEIRKRDGIKGRHLSRVHVTAAVVQERSGD